MCFHVWLEWELGGGGIRSLELLDRHGQGHGRGLISLLVLAGVSRVELTGCW
jgi:hypothetical protein